jgi:diaminopimelate epimerase
MAKMSLVKMHGTGNDFLISDCTQIDHFARLSSPQELSKTLCKRKFSVGADGLLFLRLPETKNADLKWEFYNSDGSSAEMCGNAARCVGKYWLESHPDLQSVSVETLGGVIELKKHELGIQVQMPTAHGYQQISNQGPEHTFINTGVPHAVVELQKWDVKVMTDLAQQIKSQSSYKEHGTNVTFFLKEGDSIKAMTHERGVEDFTLSCGTGAVAAAVVALKNNPGQVSVSLPGGDVLVIHDSASYLCGPAEFVADIQINLNESF